MKRLSDQTLYEILEIEPDAPVADIAAAFERARAIYGPGSLATYTLMTPDEAELLTSRIEEAGRTLLDPELRSRYDRSLTSPDAGELRAAVNAHAGPPGGTSGTNGASAPFALPPVIPALQPAEPSPPSPDRAAPRRDDAAAALQTPAPLPPSAPEASAPERSERAPVETAPPPPAPAAPAPIRLDREIRPAEPPRAPPAEPPPAPAAPAAVEVPLPEGSVWTGEALRRVREARGITVAQIAERTKVTRHHVENVEADRFSALPAPVYLRGILLSIARELRLDGQKVARSYLERVAAAGKK